MINKKLQKRLSYELLAGLFLIGIFSLYFVVASGEKIFDTKSLGWITASEGEPSWNGNYSIFTELINIEYKDNNMTVEFKDGGTFIGQTTLKSHKTYDEILKVTTGKNKTVIWYEFSEFENLQSNAFGEVEFIDMREFIENKSYTKQFEEIEKMNETLVLISNPDYLKPIEKNYTLVYKNGNDWLPYNSLDIPKENIIIGVQTDLFWGEFLDVRLNVLNNKLDRHALVLGTNCGFVTEAPTDDPDGPTSWRYSKEANALKFTSPATAAKIIEIGFYVNGASEEANFEVGVYTDDGEPLTLIGSNKTNAKGTTAGWKNSIVDISISPNTAYWIAVQIDDTTTQTRVDHAFTGGVHSVDGSVDTLPEPWVQSTSSNDLGAIYAVWEAGAPPENCWTKTGTGRGSILEIPRGCVYEINSGEVG